MFRIERKEICNLILNDLPLPVEAIHFLCHSHDFTCQLLLELFDVCLELGQIL